MATMQELESALRKAHAAGNADHARVFAAEIRRLRETGGGADFSGVTGGARLAQTPETPPDPTEGMGTGERIAAGLGRSFVELGRGLKQNATNAAIGLGSRFAGAPEFRQALRQQTAPIQQRQQAEIDEARALDAPLMATGGGQVGNALGIIAQLAGPAYLARGSSVAGAFLPATIRGNAAQGAGLGALQPTTTGESRGLNALMGGAAGGAGAAVFKGAGTGINALRNIGRQGVDGTDRAAATMLAEQAADPASITRAAPSAVPGVQRTLAEETLDPGIARLERNMRSTSNQFDAIDRSNNAARVRALEGFAGDSASLSAARSERTRETSGLLNQAMQEGGVNVTAIRESLASQIESSATRPAVQSALRDVNAALSNAGDDVFGLYGVRKTVDDLLSGKAGGDKSYARAATRELMQFKNQLDDEIAKASPTFGQYLNRYREMSVPINRMQIGQAMMDSKSGSAILDPVTGVQVLTPAQFSRKSRSLDDIAAKATGFSKAKASDILQAGDIAVIKAIQDDLERQAFRATAGSGGNSQTFERAALDNQLSRRVGSDLAGQIPMVGPYIRDFVGVLDKTRNERIKERLAYLVANPEEARRVIAALPPAGQAIVTKALTQLGGSSGVAAGVTALGAGGLESDVTGGTPVPAAEFDQGPY